LIYGGFSYITSLGDPKGIQAAKGKITNALIGFFIVLGFFIVFFSYFIIRLIAEIFNIEPIQEVFQNFSHLPTH